MGWSIEWGSAGGGSLTHLEDSFPLYFVKRLNGVGFHSALINNPSTKPQNEELVRFVWDRGGSGEVTHFEGYITDVRRMQETNSFLVRGLDLNGLLWQSTIAALREYSSENPFNILTSTGTPKGLIFNGQSNRKPIGSTTLQYGADGTKPNQIDSTTTGDSLTFRTDSGRTWVNIQRLLLQARATGDYPTWVSGGDDYGLEAYVELTGANNDEPRLFVVTRREPSANASPTTITYPTGFQDFRRGSEGLTASDAVKVVGSGSGFSRTESSFAGSGGIEGIVTDKTIINDTASNNQSNRLQTLLDPTTDVITTVTGEHYRDWVPGHRYTLGFPNISNETLRLFTKSYVIGEESFKLIFGRPRPLPNDPFRSVANLAGGHAQGSQLTDLKPETLFADSGSRFLQFGPGSSFNIASNGTSSNTDWNETNLPTDYGVSEGYWMRLELTATVSASRLEVEYDKTSDVTIGGANSGNAGSDPHDHTTSLSFSGTQAAVTQAGPYEVQVKAVIDGSTERRLASWVIPSKQTAMRVTATYPFSVVEGESEMTEIRVLVTNHGDNQVTIGSGSNLRIVKDGLHRHNA